MKLSVEVTGIEEQRLSEVARRLNVPEEDLALATVRDLLAQREADFGRNPACRLLPLSGRLSPGSRLLEKVRMRTRPLKDDDAGFAFVDEEPVRFDVALTPADEFPFQCVIPES